VKNTIISLPLMTSGFALTNINGTVLTRLLRWFKSLVMR